MEREKQVFRTARLFVVGIVLLCLIASLFSTSIELYPVDMTYPTRNEGWAQVFEDGTRVPLATAQDFAPVEAGQTLVLERELAAIETEDLVLMFQTKNQEVRVFIEDELIYAFEMQKGFRFLETPGNEWHQIFVSPDMTGKMMRVELTSQFAYYSNLVYDFYRVHYREMLGIQMQWQWLRIATGVFLLVIAVLSFINARIWSGTQTRYYLIALGEFYGVVCIWVFANAGIFDILFCRPLLSYFLEMFSVRLIPVMAYLFVRKTLSRYYPLLSIVGYLTLGQFFLSVILQFVFHVSFIKTIWMVHVILIAGAMLNFGMIAHYLHRTRKEKEQRNWLFVCTGVIFVSGLFEVWRFYALPEKEMLISFFIAISYVLYTCIAHVLLVHRSAGLDRGKVAMETNYNKLQNTTLMRQINAHFFFNALNVVSALCKTSPQKADEAVNLLAKYMRHYMYFINTSKTIDFINELDLMRVYLKIEQMRFANSFEVKWEIGFTAFQVPPLSLQPVVENAIMHGLRHKEGYGTIKITSKKVGTCVVVMIEDNGAGFDVSLLDHKESLAIDNIRTRLSSMANASIEIDSKVGVGTRVIVQFPL